MTEQKKPYLSVQEITEVFINTPLEDDYNFLQADLEKLANAFINAAATKIAKEERDACIEIATNLNRLVGEKIAEVRG
jgi:hypothetical protein